MHYWTRDFGNGPSWTWNNEQDQGFELSQQNNDRYGYIVEFAPVPEPLTFAITAIAAALSLGYVWSRRHAAQPEQSRQEITLS